MATASGVVARPMSLESVSAKTTSSVAIEPGGEVGDRSLGQRPRLGRLDRGEGREGQAEQGDDGVSREETEGQAYCISNRATCGA
jgi:hypothetical protein